MILFPNCKINLGLHILRKRADGFHDLDTIFYPIPLQDALEIVQCADGKNAVSIETSGLPIDANEENNICVTAYGLLNQHFPLPSVKIHLHKSIPSGAGLGGGSADGAFTLLLLNKKFKLGLSEDQLIDYALQLGSDCPFFIKNKPCVGTGRGEKLTELQLDLSSYKIVLVNPGIHINTGWAFSQLTPRDERMPISQVIQLPIAEWKTELTNDFEEQIFKDHPAINDIKEVLYGQGALYASMSGSGSTVFGIFPKEAGTSFTFPQHYFVQEIV